MVLNRCITTKKEDEKIFIRMNYELMEDTYIDWNTDGQKEKEEEDDIDDESSSNPPLQVKIKDNYKLTPMEHSLLEDINFHPTKLMVINLFSIDLLYHSKDFVSFTLCIPSLFHSFFGKFSSSILHFFQGA